MVAGVGAVILVVALAFWSGLVDRLPTGTGAWQGDLAVLAFLLAISALLHAAGRFAPSEPRANLGAEQRRAWREFQRLYGEDDAVAAISAPLAAMAWGDKATTYQVVAAMYLAGNEAETHLFGLDRLAFCCRADGSVPIDPAERLAAAEALALHGRALHPSDAFLAAALALVRLAQHRPEEAADLLRHHLDRDPQIRALFAVALLDGDPDAARREARAAWESLGEDERKLPRVGTVRHALAHVEGQAPQPEM
jgi:hypothetical protein